MVEEMAMSPDDLTTVGKKILPHDAMGATGEAFSPVMGLG